MKYDVSLCSGSSSSCLDNIPDSPITISNANHDKLPGQVYDGDAQCALQYGAEYKLCTRKKVTQITKCMQAHTFLVIWNVHPNTRTIAYRASQKTLIQAIS